MINHHNDKCFTTKIGGDQMSLAPPTVEMREPVSTLKAAPAVSPLRRWT